MHEYLFDEIKKLSIDFTRGLIEYDELDFLISECQVMKDINIEISKLTNNNNISRIVFEIVSNCLWTNCADILKNNGYEDEYQTECGERLFHKKSNNPLY